MSTPDGRVTITARLVRAISFTALFACSPGDITSGGETELSGETGESEAGGGEAVRFDVECDPDGTCWARTSEWPEWLQHATTLAPLHDNSLLVEDEQLPGCWVHWAAVPRMCEVEFEGVELVGRPVEDLDLTPEDCAEGWPTATAGGKCWLVLGDLAVELR